MKVYWLPQIAMMLSLLFNKPYGIVETGLYFAGVDGTAVLSMEGQFNPKAFRREPRGHTSRGPWQIDDEWWPQWPNDLMLHLAQGAAIWKMYSDQHPNDFAMAVACYNGGDHPGAYSRWWGRKVKARRDSIELYIWRHLR